GTWTSGNPLIASVGTGSGMVTGVSVGSTVITYSLGAGCTATAPVTVNPLPTAIAGTTYVCVGGTTALSDPVPGGVWSSSNSGIAAIGTTGTVSGASGGTATISYTASSGCAATVVMSVIAVPAI